MKDDKAKIEAVVPHLEQILVVDERNLTALGTLAEHAALLMNWYGVGGPWTQKFEDYRIRFEALTAKLEHPKPSDEMDRALALKALALNNLSEGYSGLQESLKKYTTADDTTLLLLAELSWRLEKNDESKKWLERVTNKTSPRARYILAMVDQDSSALKTLASEGYLPAKIEVFIRQTAEAKNISTLIRI
jgi:hypothetical protein